MNLRSNIVSVAVGGVVLAAALAPAPAPADESGLQQAIARGHEAFLHEHFGASSGRVCDTCHSGGGRQPGMRPDGVPIPSLNNAATIFPRLDEDGQRLITLPDQVRACVGGAIGGKPPAYGSDALNALVAYVTSLSQGKPIDMGADPH